MEQRIVLSVYRRLDNRFENLPDDSPRALELHERRKQALHEVLDGQKDLRVVDWGDTDDARPHELVTIVVAFAAPLVVSGLKYLGEKLAEKAVDEGATSVVKWLVSKLHGKQEEKKLLDFTMQLPDGTTIRCDPPAGKTKVTVSFKDGTVEQVEYTHEG